jgi:hypothetical protein
LFSLSDILKNINKVQNDISKFSKNNLSEPPLVENASLMSFYKKVQENIFSKVKDDLHTKVYNFKLLFYSFTYITYMLMQFLPAFTPKFSQLIHKYVAYTKTLAKNQELLYWYKNDMLDIAQQTYIFIAILLPFVLVTITPYNKNMVTIPTFNSIQGIGGIKELLYGDFSLFLILSTLVLLVALLGAAIMTRKKLKQ